MGRDGSGKLWSDQNVNGLGGPGAQQGTDAILIQDNETKQNRMYGYIIMASSVVVLAVLMVIIFCKSCNAKFTTLILYSYTISKSTSSY